MRQLAYTSKTFQADLAAFCQEAAVPKELSDSVATILADVRTRGDEAVTYYAAKFDGAKLRGRDFAVRPEEVAAAVQRLPQSDLKAMRAAHAAIIDFNRRGRPKAWSGRNKHGARVGEVFHPIRRVGLYVPGGEVPLVSSVLMTATLARLAGCPEVAVFTPSNAQGRIADGILAALDLVGVSEIYRIGGVQAIGAMTYGTATIRPVDKVFGPGNAYVCEAKRQVFGTVGVDLLPGPSEVMVIADASVNPEYAAADLLAQAEHGSGREKVFLVGLSAKVVPAVLAAVDAQLATLSRVEKTRKVISEGLLAITVDSLEQAAEVANFVAPEHLELLVKPAAARVLSRTITTAGALLVGPHTPTALGDFVAGPSHVLPTGRSGRFFSGLRVTDFLRRTSVLQYDEKSVRRAEPVVAAFAAMERLDGHGRSVRLRTP